MAWLEITHYKGILWYIKWPLFLVFLIPYWLFLKLTHADVLEQVIIVN